jgi:uncharacterized protein (TIGR01777 family)
VSRDQRVELATEIDAPAEAAFAWLAAPEALPRLIPPWEHACVVDRHGGVEEGARVILRVGVAGPWNRSWMACHEAIEEGHRFCDRQDSGPFAHWVHAHQVDPIDPARCLLNEVVEYRLPFSLVASPFLGRAVRRRIENMLAYRGRVAPNEIAMRWRWAESPLRRVLVSGSTGLIGEELVACLKAQGRVAWRLARRENPKHGLQIVWDPEAGQIDPAALEGFDAVIHLGGASIADGRWTDRRKRLIRESRVTPTRLLAETLARCARPPRVFLCASAVGFYGARGDKPVDESSIVGHDFLAKTCQEWETACEPLRRVGSRVVNLRLGAVLTPRGGALARMLPVFRKGLGGPMGGGRQWMSWIAMDDAMGAILHCIETEELAGPVNVASPEPVTNDQFAHVLGRVLGRPAFVPTPGWALRLALGEMADALLLSGARVLPMALARSGYAFRFPTLEGALRHLLGRV